MDLKRKVLKGCTLPVRAKGVDTVTLVSPSANRLRTIRVVEKTVLRDYLRESQHTLDKRNQDIRNEMKEEGIFS